MRKLSLLLSLASFSLHASLHRIRTIKQTGRGSIGKVQIIFMQGNYSVDDVVKDYTDNTVELSLQNAFIIPVKRVFKSSSEKSSVSRIVVNQEGGDVARVSIYFRIPIDIIKQEDSIYTQGNILIYQYNTKPKAVAPVSTITEKPKESPTPHQVQQIKPPKKQNKILPIMARRAYTKAKKDTLSLSTVLLYALVLSAIIFILIVLYTIRKFTIYKNLELRKIEDEYGTIRLVDTLKLGFTKKLLVIEVEQKRLLLAVYKGKLRLLTELGQVYYEEAPSPETSPNLFEHITEEDSFNMEGEFKTRLK